MQYFCSLPYKHSAAKLFFFAVTKNRIGHGPRCRHSRSRRAIHRCSNDGAASIRKSEPEIKNRCTQEGVNRQDLASIPKFGPEIKNRCTQGGVNRQNLASIPKSGLEIKNRCTLEGVNGENLASIPKSGPEIKNRCTQGAGNRKNLASIRKSGPEIKNRCTQEGESGQETLEGVKTDNVFIQWNGNDKGKEFN